MLIRALLAVLVLPGVFAGVIPAWIAAVDPWRGSGHVLGSALLAFGLGILGWCVRDFLVAGRGTLAPWDPPRRLVVVGLYRITRNPMYVGLLAVLAGLGALVGSPLVALYGAGLALAFHLRVVLYEEPTLELLFGEQWAAYKERVPRWLGLRFAPSR
jgi:protein-S-isoprenylcysteine O-methyltransferase Ste14